MNHGAPSWSGGRNPCYLLLTSLAVVGSTARWHCTPLPLRWCRTCTTAPLLRLLCFHCEVTASSSTLAPIFLHIFPAWGPRQHCGQAPLHVAGHVCTGSRTLRNWQAAPGVHCTVLSTPGVQYTPCNLWSIGKCSQHFNADFLWWGLNTFNCEIGRHGMHIKW